MHLPTADDVNATRLARFDDSISAALEQEARIAKFRDIISHYVEHHDVPEADVAAALAVMAQGETPLLIDPEDEPRREEFAGPRGERGDRPAGRAVDRSAGPREGFTTYKIAVGKRHKVEPRQIVGAIANEGGLSRSDFGAIRITPEFSLVDLPSNLSEETFRKLRGTRISGKLIELQVDKGPHGNRGPKAPRGVDADRKPRKPRHPKHQ